MVRRVRLVFTSLAAALALATAGGLDAQEMGRYRVLIPNFEPLEGANRRFGENAARELRELINTLATHQPIDRREIDTALRRFRMRMEELDCIRTRQLATQINAQVALCATYGGPANDYRVTAEFWDIASGESFSVDPTRGVERQEKAAAQHIFDQFDRYVQQVRFAQFCEDYALSQQWDNALSMCDQALALNPTAVGTRYRRARILFDSERLPESLQELERVLELSPFHEDGLQLAGFISARLGQDDQALKYYQQYLDLNPGSAAVRMRIAYELAQAGDPRGAMQLIQVGLDMEPDNTDLLEQFGGFAFAAALDINQRAAVGSQDAGALVPEAAEYFRRAVQAYDKVFSIKGAETPVGHLRNIIAAHVQLEDLNQAVDVGRRALETHPNEDVIWSVYADALQRSGRLDEALAALDRVRELNPSFANVSLRQGNWLIQAGRIADAVAVLKESAGQDPERAEQAVRLIFNDGYSKGIQRNDFAYAIRTFSAAKELPNLTPGWQQQLNFWHGWAVFNSAMRDQEPGTLATARATLPRFQEALQLFRGVGDYPRTVNVNITQVIANTNTYIEIQEAIIRRGR